VWAVYQPRACPQAGAAQTPPASGASPGTSSERCARFRSTPELFGGLPGEVGAGVVPDPARRAQVEIDVAVFAPAVPGERRRVLSLGEAKWGEPMGVRHVGRLRRDRDLLAGKGYDTRDTVLACYGGAGFEPALRNASGPDRVLTVGLDDLYAEVT
jgi:hypothetical protein